MKNRQTKKESKTAGVHGQTEENAPHMHRKNQLDERQEQELLRIEKNSFWLLYFLTTAVILFRRFTGGWQLMSGEEICLLVVSVYLVAACLRRGIWDRRLKADLATNLRVSVAVALAAGCIGTVTVCRMASRAIEAWLGCLIFGIFFASTFVLALGALSFCTAIYRRRMRALEDQGDE